VVDLLQDIRDRVSSLAGDWTKYTLVGSFLLYVAGYLALRFHLTAIGIGTDLTVVDERYLFTGARFLVYLVAAIPSMLLLLLPIAAAAVVLWKFVPRAFRFTLGTWTVDATALAAAGIVFALVMIQFVMRQCFRFTNVFLMPQLPEEPAYLVGLLLDDELMPLYYAALVAGCAVPLGVLAAVRFRPVPSILRGLLAFLVAVQLLLLPVNYGVLILDKELPRVRSIGPTALADGQDAWLVWEGTEGVTFLVRDRDRRERMLVTVPRSDVKRTEIVAFDRIVPTLFAGERRGE
jgi:hypothetical protein